MSCVMCLNSNLEIQSILVSELQVQSVSVSVVWCDCLLITK